MKKVENKNVETYRLKTLSIKEIHDKYPDKYVETYSEGKDAIVVLDRLRIRFTNKKEEVENGIWFIWDKPKNGHT